MAEGPSKPQPPRFRDGSSSLEEVLWHYVTTPTKIMYGDRPGKSALGCTVLKRHGPLLLKLRALQLNLSFKKATMVEALVKVAERRQAAWLWRKRRQRLVREGR